MDCSLLGSSIHGIFQARVLEWGAIAFISHPNSTICILLKSKVLGKVGRREERTKNGMWNGCTWHREWNSASEFHNQAGRGPGNLTVLPCSVLESTAGLSNCGCCQKEGCFKPHPVGRIVWYEVNTPIISLLAGTLQTVALLIRKWPG